MSAEAYLAKLRDEFPKLRLIDKASDPFSRLIDIALRVLTLGGQSRYIVDYVTTIGQRIYLPSTWKTRSPEQRYITLRHEAVHLRQFRRYGLLGMGLLYLLPLFPLGLAWVGHAWSGRPTRRRCGPRPRSLELMRRVTVRSAITLHASSLGQHTVGCGRFLKRCGGGSNGSCRLFGGA